MSKSDVARVVSRGVSIYLLLSGLIDLTYVPEHIMSLVHDLVPTPVLELRQSSTAVYWRNLHMLTLGLLIMRIGILLAASAMLYKFTPQVANFFLTNENDSNRDETVV